MGPVPILKLRGRKLYNNGFWIGAEADEFYVPVSYINGSDNEVIGAIHDRLGGAEPEAVLIALWRSRKGPSFSYAVLLSYRLPFIFFIRENRGRNDNAKEAPA